MHLDLYTHNSALTQKAKFWCNYVGALKGKHAVALGHIIILVCSSHIYYVCITQYVCMYV
jgi:hypothetical protein